MIVRKLIKLEEVFHTPGNSGGLGIQSYLVLPKALIIALTVWLWLVCFFPLDKLSPDDRKEVCYQLMPPPSPTPAPVILCL